MPQERRLRFRGVQKEETSVCHVTRRCGRACNLLCGEKGALGSLGSTQTLSSVLKEEMQSPEHGEVVGEESEDTVVIGCIFS